MYTLDYGVLYISYSAVLEWYNDVSLISHTKNSKFISGYVFTLGGVDVS
jgi:hypothetical protein